MLYPPSCQHKKSVSAVIYVLIGVTDLGDVIHPKNAYCFCNNQRLMCIFISGRNRLNFHDQSSEAVSDQ